MSRRTATLSVATLLLVVAVAVALLLPVPFVTTSPGPTVNTLGVVNGKPVIEITGHRTFPTTGQLDLTTVSVTSPESRVSLPQAVQAWFDPHREVLPRDVVYPPDQSVSQVKERNAEEMQTSQQAAVVAALRQVGIDVSAAVVVQAISAGAPALGHLRAGDVIEAVNGVEVRAPEQVGEALQRTAPGEAARFVVKRGDAEVPVSTPTEPDPENPRRTRVGISVANGFDLPFDVSIRLGAEIGGPSAGSMFALAIVDKLTPGALTGGAVVAGTGTISADGVVGEIGGVQQKIVGALGDGAEIFLVPQANCAEALSADIGGDALRLVKILRLRDAVRSLEALTADPNAAVPSCAG